jgi:hypothetical protein
MSTRRDRKDVTQALSLHLYVEDCKKHRDQRRNHTYCLALVEIGEHVGRRDVTEPFSQRPDAAAEHVGDRADQYGPRSSVPEANTVCVEETARA